MKISTNSPCPCGSGNKYKKCCQRYHKGALPPDALSLMKSRYSAYTAGESRYIIATTHPDNPDYKEEQKAWREEIDLFCRHTVFLGLEILASMEAEREATVTFIAKLSTGELREKSRFLKEEGRWLYLDGVIS